MYKVQYYVGISLLAKLLLWSFKRIIHLYICTFVVLQVERESVLDWVVPLQDEELQAREEVV